LPEKQEVVEVNYEDLNNEDIPDWNNRPTRQ
jgi:hypothetical protein